MVLIEQRQIGLADIVGGGNGFNILKKGFSGRRSAMRISGFLSMDNSDLTRPGLKTRLFMPSQLN